MRSRRIAAPNIGAWHRAATVRDDFGGIPTFADAV